MDVTIHKIAQKMFLAFERSFTVFTQLTRQSQAAFEDNDWPMIQYLSQQRIDVYEANLEEDGNEAQSVESGFRGVFRGFDGLEEMIRTCRYPRIMVQPIAIYRSVKPNKALQRTSR